MSMYMSNHADIVSFFGCTPIMYATLRVTNACNLYCKHCYANASNEVDLSEELDFNELVNVLNVLKEKGVSRLSISGGEPFCRKDIYDLLRVASDLEFDIYISTNGVNSISIEKLRNLRIKVLQVSIDGFESTHDHIRGKKGTFDQAVKFLKDMHNCHTTITGVAFSLMRANQEDILRFYEYVHDNNLADVFSVIPVQKLGRADQSDVLPVTDLQAVLHKLACYYIRSDKTVALNIMVPPAIVPKEIADTEFGKGYICEFPYSIAIDAIGNCALCDGLLNLPEFKSINLRNGGNYCDKLFQIPSTDKWLKTSPTVLEGVCSRCCFVDLCCGGCRVDSYLNTDKIFASDPLCQRYYDAGIFPEEYLYY